MKQKTSDNKCKNTLNIINTYTYKYKLILQFQQNLERREKGKQYFEAVGLWMVL